MAAPPPAEAESNSSPSIPPLDRGRHLKYWKRCLRTVLPTQYTSQDSSRMVLGFFILSAVDLLSSPSSSTGPPPEELLTHTDRRQLRNWVLACQHPAGGFCGSPTHVPPSTISTGASTTPPHSHGSGTHDGAYLAATAFALLLLPLLCANEAVDGHDGARTAYNGVQRRATLAWLRRLQRRDGSFGETLGEGLPGNDATSGDGGRDEAQIAGGRDMRYAYFAAMTRWMLRGGEGSEEEDIDVDALVGFIRRAQTYDGGVAETGMHEPHGEFTAFDLFVSTCALADNVPRQLATHSAQSRLSPCLTARTHL